MDLSKYVQYKESDIGGSRTIGCNLFLIKRVNTSLEMCNGRDCINCVQNQLRYSNAKVNQIKILEI